MSSAQEIARQFTSNLAVVIGIDDYPVESGIPRLRGAVADAEAVADALAGGHRYEVLRLIDPPPTSAAIRAMLASLPHQLAPGARLVIYFAGHGVTLPSPKGVAGHLLLADAKRDDERTFLPMQVLHDSLAPLVSTDDGPARCRHQLVILDCCFAATFHWTATREVGLPARVSTARYQRYVDSPAHQLLASAAADQRSIDVLGDRSGSPFVTELLAGLAGGADDDSDGLVTVTDLHRYIEKRVHAQARAIGVAQTPRLLPLPGHGAGEFLFAVPNQRLSLAAPATLEDGANPYRGLESYEGGHEEHFHGRRRVWFSAVKHLVARRLTVITGPSGTGKSSLARAAILPSLQRACRRDGSSRYEMIGPMRPAQAIQRKLAARTLARASVVCIDQFEELFNDEVSETDRQELLDALGGWIADRALEHRILLTMRSDVEPRLRNTALQEAWLLGRLVIPPPTQDELREIIVGPANALDMYFDPPGIVEDIINEVVQVPGALPLLSFLLKELYAKRNKVRRTMRGEVYRAMGGVAGALTSRAGLELAALDVDKQRLLRTIMLRMVAPAGAGLARRRIAASEVGYPNSKDDAPSRQVVERFVEARLLVKGGDADPSKPAWIEPAHDALIGGWNQLSEWIKESAVQLPLLREVSAVAAAWDASKRVAGQLWDRDPRLSLVAEHAARKQLAFNKVERDFIALSVRRRWRRVVGAFLVGLVVISVFAYIASVAQDRANEAAAEAVRADVHTALERIARGNAEDQTRRADGNAGLAKQNADRANQNLQLANTRATALERTNLVLTQQNREILGRQLAAQSAFESDHDERSLLLAVQSSKMSDDGFTRQALAAALARTEHIEANMKISTDRAGPGNYRVAISADGRQVAVGGCAGSVEVRDLGASSGRIIALPNDLRVGTKLTVDEVNCSVEVAAIAFSRDGRVLAVARRDRVMLKVLRADSVLRDRLVPPTDPTDPQRTQGGKALALSDDASELAVVDDAGVQLWDTRTGTRRSRFEVQGVAVVGYFHQSPRLVVGRHDGTIELRSSDDLHGPPVTLSAHASALRYVKVLDGDDTLVSASSQELILWDLTGKQPTIKRRFATPFDAVDAIAVSAGGEYVAYSARNQIVTEGLEDRSLGRVSLPTYSAQVESLEFDAGGRHLVYGGTNRAAVIRGSRGTALPADVARSLQWITADRSGGYFAVSRGGDHVLCQIGTPISCKKLPAQVTRLAFDPAHDRVAAFEPDGLRIRSVPALSLRRAIPQATEPSYLRFSADGDRLAVFDVEGLTIYDPKTGARLGHRCPASDGAEARIVAISPDLSLYVQVHAMDTMLDWRDTRTCGLVARIVAAPRNAKLPVSGLTFLRDGSNRLVGTRGRDLVLIPRKDAALNGFPLFLGDVGSILDVTADGRFLLGRDEDDTHVRLIDVGTGNVIARYTADRVALSGDGQALLVVERDAVSRIDLHLSSWQQKACARVSRPLSQEEWRTYLPTVPFECTCCLARPSTSDRTR